jgi:hypothetical protein
MGKLQAIQPAKCLEAACSFYLPTRFLVFFNNETLKLYNS